MLVLNNIYVYQESQILNKGVSLVNDGVTKEYGKCVNVVHVVDRRFNVQNNLNDDPVGE